VIRKPFKGFVEFQFLVIIRPMLNYFAPQEKRIRSDELDMVSYMKMRKLKKKKSKLLSNDSS
jgi:hypothetical protein